MIELPEAVVLSKQVNETIKGKKIIKVIAAQSSHKFAWYYGDPKNYNDLLVGKVIGTAVNSGGLVEIQVDGVILLLGDGVNMRYFVSDSVLPSKHQLWISFEDGSSLVNSIQMYGGMWAFPEGSFDNKYYRISKEKPSPFTNEFDESYFNTLFNEETKKYSLKAFLATEQRIPGLGNGVLQDILFNARMHPKKKVNILSIKDRIELFNSIKSTLKHMADEGGRDTETNLYGNNGGYKTILSRNTVGKPCPICSTIIKKEAYMGGSIYFCPKCQKN
ncbi:endonuclease VIII [Candidatus Bathyarchaeota archaeon]|nr:endonuclease VIII [Candidatus Bathyarchaeota archaeon]